VLFFGHEIAESLEDHVGTVLITSSARIQEYTLEDSWHYLSDDLEGASITIFIELLVCTWADFHLYYEHRFFLLRCAQDGSNKGSASECFQSHDIAHIGEKELGLVGMLVSSLRHDNLEVMVSMTGLL